MKHFITEKEWKKLEKVLMECEIPYSVSFNSHINVTSTFITYDKNITIDCITIQTEMKYKEEA